MTIDEQIENLKNIGLIVENEEYAKKILNDISYFRLIKAYSINLKSKNGKYCEKVTFEQIVELYLFNANFRQVIFPEIEKVEINVRCRIANYFAEKYGVLGYLEADNFVNAEYHKDLHKFGYYSVPNAMWDWWSIGGRYIGRFIVKKDCDDYLDSSVKEAVKFIPKGYKAVDGARICDIEWGIMNKVSVKKYLRDYYNFKRMYTFEK